MLAVLKEERDDVEMVENLSSLHIFIPFFPLISIPSLKKVHIKRKKKLRTELWLLIIHTFLIYLSP